MLEPVREWSAYPILDFRITNNISYWGVRGGEAPPLTGGFGEAKPPRKRERGVLPNPVEAHHPLYGLDKHLAWVYKSVVRQKLVKTFDSYGFKFLMVKAEYLTLTFFSVPRTDCKLKLQVRLSAERPSCHINLPIRARDK